MKNKWRNYALKDGKVQSSYIREYCNRKKVRKTREASNCDSNEQSRKEQEEIEELIRLPIPPAISELLEEEVEFLGKIVPLTEDLFPRDPDAEKEVKFIYKPPSEAKERNSEIKTPEKEVDANDRINAERRSNQKAERGQDTQSSSSSERLMDMQDLPGKSNGVRRKTRRSKKNNDGSQNLKGD